MQPPLRHNVYSLPYCRAKIKQNRSDATFAGILCGLAVVFEPYAGIQDVAQQVCILYTGQTLKAVGALRQKQLKDLLHFLFIAGLGAQAFQRIVGTFALIALQVVVGIQ